MSIVGNAVGRMYIVEIRQEQTSCDIKYFPVTLGGLIKAMHNTYRLRDGVLLVQNVVMVIWKMMAGKMLQLWLCKAPKKELSTVE